MRSIPVLLFGALFLSSCDEKIELIPKVDADAAQDVLREEIGVRDQDIISLKSDIDSLSVARDALSSTNKQVILSIAKRVEELHADSLSSNNILDEVRKEKEIAGKYLAERQLRKARGEEVTMFCANGPWDRWPKMIEEAKATISNNEAVETELTKIMKALQSASAQMSNGEQGAADQSAIAEESKSESKTKPESEGDTQ